MLNVLSCIVQRQLKKIEVHSVNNCVVGLYCEISCCNLVCMASVVLEEALNMKGYLLKVLHVSRCYLLWSMKKSVVRCCHGPSGMSLGSMGCVACIAFCWVQMLYLFT